MHLRSFSHDVFGAANFLAYFTVTCRDIWVKIGAIEVPFWSRDGLGQGVCRRKILYRGSENMGNGSRTCPPLRQLPNVPTVPNMVTEAEQVCWYIAYSFS